MAVRHRVLNTNKGRMMGIGSFRQRAKSVVAPMATATRCILDGHGPESFQRLHPMLLVPLKLLIEITQVAAGQLLFLLIGENFPGHLEKPLLFFL